MMLWQSKPPDAEARLGRRAEEKRRVERPVGIRMVKVGLCVANGGGTVWAGGGDGADKQIGDDRSSARQLTGYEW